MLINSAAEFNVEQIRDIQWNDAPFENLVLEGARKDLVRALVESYVHDKLPDDFVEGKGQGLVINLFGRIFLRRDGLKG